MKTTTVTVNVTAIPEVRELIDAALSVKWEAAREGKVMSWSDVMHRLNVALEQVMREAP